MSKKEFIIILSIIIIIVLGIIIIKKSSKTENTQENKIDIPINQIATKKKTEKFEIYNTNIKSEYGRTELKATIKNITNNRTEEQRLTIVLLDENKNEIGQLVAIVPSLKSGDSTNIVAENLTVYENIYDFEIR